MKIKTTLSAIGLLLILASCKTQQASVKKIEQEQKKEAFQFPIATWVLQNENGDLVGSENKMIQISFKNEGSWIVDGYLGCNNGNGGVEVDGTGKIKFQQMMVTTKYCSDFPEENRILELFDKINRYEIQGEELHLFDNQIELMRFRLKK